MSDILKLLDGINDIADALKKCLAPIDSQKADLEDVNSAVDSEKSESEEHESEEHEASEESSEIRDETYDDLDNIEDIKGLSVNIEDHPAMVLIDDLPESGYKIKISDIVADALVQIEDVINSTIDDLNTIADCIKEDEPMELEALAMLADNMDMDENLRKYAKVIDQLILNLSSRAQHNVDDSIMQATYKQRAKELEEKYGGAKRQYDEENGAKQAKEDIRKDIKSREHRVLQDSLSTRYCPDHPGEMLIRIGEDVYQCSLDRKEYDFVNGYTRMDGVKVPGSSAQNQTSAENVVGDTSFSTREQKLGS